VDSSGKTACLEVVMGEPVDQQGDLDYCANSGGAQATRLDPDLGEGYHNIYISIGRMN